MNQFKDGYEKHTSYVDEEWLEFLGLDGYLISNHGRVYSMADEEVLEDSVKLHRDNNPTVTVEGNEYRLYIYPNEAVAFRVNEED